MNHLSSRRIILAVILITIIIPACSALQIDLSPTQIPEGGQVTLTIHGLANDSIFAINIQSNVKAKSDGTFDFSTNNFYMPFNLEQGKIVFSAKNVMTKGDPPYGYAAGLEARPPGESGIISMKSAENPYNSGSVLMQRPGLGIPQGTFEFIHIFGNAKEAGGIIPVSLEFNGIKKGPDDSTMTFGLTGVSSGSATILVTVNGNLVHDPWMVTIGSPPPTTTGTTTAATTVPTTTTTGTTTATTTTTTGTSAGTGSPTAPVTPTIIPYTQVPSLIVTSLDTRVSLLTDPSEVGASNPADLRIMDVGELAPVTEWTALSDAYLIYPEQTIFTPWSLLSISMEDTVYKELNRYSPVIVRYDGTRWVRIDTGRDGKWVNAHITTGGRYALVTPKVPATSRPTGGSPTVSGTIIPGSTTTIASETSPGLSGTQPGTSQPTSTPGSGPYVLTVILMTMAALALISKWKK